MTASHSATSFPEIDPDTVPDGLSADTAAALQAAAIGAMSGSYSPYSNFPVGCALLVEVPPQDDDSNKTEVAGVTPAFLTRADRCPGRPECVIVTGANVENAAYPAGSCAERVALGIAVHGLSLLRRTPGPAGPGLPWTAGLLKAAVVVTRSPGRLPSSPCGVCRQFISEFCDPKMPLLMVGLDKAQWTSVEELLPFGFGPGNLE